VGENFQFSIPQQSLASRWSTLKKK
jgi:hypothetical protein